MAPSPATAGSRDAGGGDASRAQPLERPGPPTVAAATEAATGVPRGIGAPAKSAAARPLVNDPRAWRDAYARAFHARRRAIASAVAAQRIAALAERSKALPLPAALPAAGGAEPARAPAPRPDNAALAERLTRALMAAVAERIAERLRHIIAAEVRRQLAAPATPDERAQHRL